MISLRELQKVVGGRTVLEIDELDVAPGEIVGVVAAPGNGKRALMDILVGRSLPTAGEVAINGSSQVDKDHMSEVVGVLFAEDGLYLSRTLLANLVLFARLRGIGRDRIATVLDLVGLKDHENKKVSSLPDGLRRRLALGVAILHQPAILLLMEPFARCDERSIAQIGSVVRAMADEGATVLILAASAGYLDSICDMIHMLDNGRIGAGYQPGQTKAENAPFKVPVRLEGRVVLVNPADILFAVAEEGKAILQTVHERLPTQFTLMELEQRLSRGGFFRAHRGYLVNMQHVAEVIPFTRSSFSLRLDDPSSTQIPLSKDAARELRDLLKY